MKYLKALGGWFLCHVLGDHAWTSRAEQGEKPTQQEIDAGVAGFWFYSRMYCKRCKKVYRP